MKQIHDIRILVGGIEKQVQNSKLDVSDAVRHALSIAQCFLGNLKGPFWFWPLITQRFCCFHDSSIIVCLRQHVWACAGCMCRDVLHDRSWFAGMSMFQHMRHGQKGVEHMSGDLRPRVEMAHITSHLHSWWGGLSHMTELSSQGGCSGVGSWLYAQLKLSRCARGVEPMLGDSYKPLPRGPSLSLYHNICSAVLFIWLCSLACELPEGQGRAFPSGSPVSGSLASWMTCSLHFWWKMNEASYSECVWGSRTRAKMSDPFIVQKAKPSLPRALRTKCAEGIWRKALLWKEWTNSAIKKKRQSKIQMWHSTAQLQRNNCLIVTRWPHFSPQSSAWADIKQVNLYVCTTFKQRQRL